MAGTNPDEKTDLLFAEKGNLQARSALPTLTRFFPDTTGLYPYIYSFKTCTVIKS